MEGTRREVSKRLSTNMPINPPPRPPPLALYRSGSIIAAPGMRSSWKRRLVERAERKAMKEREHDLKEGAKKEKEVRCSDLLYIYNIDVFTSR